MIFTEPRITLLARPSFTEPEHLPVNWLGESSDGERLAEFAGRLCYMSQKNPANRATREYLENIKKQGHGSVLEHANYSILLEGVSRSLTHELAAGRDVYLVPSAGQVMVNGIQVDEGDGVAVTNEAKIEFTALRDTQLVVVELA